MTLLSTRIISTARHGPNAALPQKHPNAPSCCGLHASTMFSRSCPNRLYNERFAVLCAARSLLSRSRPGGGELRKPSLVTCGAVFSRSYEQPHRHESVAALCTPTHFESRIARGGGYPQRCDPPHKSLPRSNVKIRSFLPSFRIWHIT